MNSYTQQHTEAVNTADSYKVLQNTYRLLSATLFFSALCAAGAMTLQLGHIASLCLNLGAFVPLFLTYKNADSAKGILWIFAFTGMVGASLGHMLNYYVGFAGGPQLVMQALGLTSIIFVSLSAYVTTTKKDFSFLGGFVMAGCMIMLACVLINFFIQSSVVFLALNAGIALLMTAAILYDTSQIIHGGETNYIRATIALYIDFINLFISLVHLLGIMNDD